MPAPGREAVFVRPAGGEAALAGLFPSPPGVTVFIDGAGVPAKAALMEALAAAFKFPAYFGRNWDALLDCLRSLPDSCPAPVYVLGVRNSSEFLKGSPRDLEDFSDVALEAAAFLSSSRGSRLVVALL